MPRLIEKTFVQQLERFPSSFWDDILVKVYDNSKQSSLWDND